MNDDLQMAQLLCTRLCHDLAGPVGAVSAGVELMGSDPSLIDDETLDLLSGSAAAASRKLKFLRIALGWPGSGSAPLGQVGTVFEDYILSITGPSGGPTLTWPDEPALTSTFNRLGDASAHVLASIALVGLEVQPKCRTLVVSIEDDGSDFRVSVANKASEDAVRVREDISDVVKHGGTGEMTPQTVQAHMARRLISASGGQFNLQVVSDGVITTAGWN